MEKNRAREREKSPRLRRGLALLLTALLAAALAVTAAGCSQAAGSAAVLLPVGWPSALQGEVYEEPPFTDVPGRTNNAFNVADFGEQGSNGWFYRYGKATKPTQSRQIETQISGSYKVSGLDGLEIKSDFVHTAAGAAPILEWRAAEDGAVNVALTYVKDVNGDSNPSFPDGVKVYVYKGEELLDSHQVEVYTDKQTLLETGVKDLEIKKGESLYFAVDPNSNNAYDGGLLYIAIDDVNTPAPAARVDSSRVNNDANNVADYGYQGKNGWTYMYGKDVTDCRLVSTETEDGYMNSTSPALVIKGDFIHPAINDKAILRWTPAVTGTIEVRGKYTKFEQNDGNPDWPDGVTVQIYLNDKKLYEKDVPAPAAGTETVTFRHVGLSVTPNDRLYFVVSANGNSSYDGGSFDITVLDRNCRTTENDIEIDESEIRQNIADVRFDFGPQGSNGWFFQEGYMDEPFGALNVKNYLTDDKYFDNHFLEIKRDYANVGENGRSAVIKWKVAQDGVIRIDASYTKAPNQDANPSWPDGTRVTLWHNSTQLTSRFFAPLTYEVTGDLSVSYLEVKRGDYITMTINGLDNNAYDGGNFRFAIMSLSGLVGPTEKDVAIPGNATRTNNANVGRDFGAQGKNGWFYQYGYNTDPFFAINVEKYNEGESYTTKDGIEIKGDYIMPSTKGKCAQVKWQVAQDGKVNVLADYTKLLNEDANPSWPDGVTVTLLYGDTVLKQEYFAPDTVNEITKDLSVFGLDVKQGEYITLIVDGGENTAYDGGLYHFAIEDANFTPPAYLPDSDNVADLAADFTGVQGANGWYYAEGRMVEQANVLTQTTGSGDGTCFTSANSVQIKKDFVEPGPDKAAMYQWVAGETGVIDILGFYTKNVQDDSNPSWPDGTHLTICLNGKELLSEDVEVFRDKENTLRFTLNDGSIKVNREDILTFMIEAKGNNAWDGGTLAVQIFPHVGEYANGTGSNNTTLGTDFTAQGANGWYTGYTVNRDGTDFVPVPPRDSKALPYGVTVKTGGGVEPAAEAGAVYRWVAAADGTIWLNGTYTKNGRGSDTAADSVHIAVYLDGKPVEGMAYDPEVKAGEETTTTEIKKDGLEIKAGQTLDFVITARGNNAWDYGTLAMTISDKAPAVEPPYVNNTGSNNTSLAGAFRGTQGEKGWYYGVCNWDGTEFATVDMQYTDAGGFGQWLYNDGKPDLHNDYVEPSGEKNAAYMWVAAQEGYIQIDGTYTKNEFCDDGDGVLIRIFQNGQEKECVTADRASDTFPVKKILHVEKEDRIIFAVDKRDKVGDDGGKLAVDIKDYTLNKLTNLAEGFRGDQERDITNAGSWYYGTCTFDGQELAVDGMEYSTEDGGKWRYNSGKPDLRKDFVEPGGGKAAAYVWVSTVNGEITVVGSYTKYSNTSEPTADGVTFRIFKNTEQKLFTDSGIKGQVASDAVVTINETFTVAEGDKIVFSVNPEGNDAWDSGKLEVSIYEGDLRGVNIGLIKPTTIAAPVMQAVAPVPVAQPVDAFVSDAEDNSSSLVEDFSELQGANGWFYGASHADGKDFASLGYDPAQAAYIGADGLTLKKDGVRPGLSGDASAAYLWVAAQDGQISLTGSYAVSAEAEEEGGVSLRVFHGEEELLSGYAPAGAQVDFDETLTVTKGEQLLFVISPEGESALDGILQVAIAPVDEPEEESEDANTADGPENVEPGEEPEEPSGDESGEAPGQEEPGGGPDAEQPDTAPDGEASDEASDKERPDGADEAGTPGQPAGPVSGDAPAEEPPEDEAEPLPDGGAEEP